MITKRETAKEFLRAIKPSQDKYKLINGLFIVKYINKDISVYVGEFRKHGTALNEGKTNKIILCESQAQHFNKSNGTTTTALNVWKKLDIGFNEMPISEVLKWY